MYDCTTDNILHRLESGTVDMNVSRDFLSLIAKQCDAMPTKAFWQHVISNLTT
jgi:hypothetical protein